MTTPMLLSRPLLLSRDLPGAVRLEPEIDASALAEDLEQVMRKSWLPEQPYRFDGLFNAEIKVYHNGDWKGLSLRSQGGSVQRTDPGGPGLDDFEDTLLMRYTPHIAEMIRGWGVSARSARLLRLPPGGTIAEHRDTYHGFEYGQLRLHVPITTNDGVTTSIRGERWHWPIGELWYGDFGSPHSVENAGATDRVHLVIDVLMTPATAALFPEPTLDLIHKTDVLYHEFPRARPQSELERLECRFALPATLVRGIFDIDDGIVGQFESRLHVRDGQLLWELDGRDVIRLLPTEDGKLMLSGWTMERYFAYELTNGRISALTLTLRRGREATRIAFEIS